jgi:hypothetical protein
MQFDITGFAIFLAFILPGFVAQKSRDSIVPRSLKPLSPVSEVGEFVLAGVWRVLWTYRFFSLLYFVLSLFVGYLLGLLQGVLILRQPLRNWAVTKSTPTRSSEKTWNYRVFAGTTCMVFRIKANRTTFINYDIPLKNTSGNGTLHVEANPFGCWSGWEIQGIMRIEF